MNTLNLFITFGDTFLPAPSCYDELYYEIVRMNNVFDNLYSLSKCTTIIINKIILDTKISIKEVYYMDKIFQLLSAQI